MRQQLETDVLVIGGGAAGMRAAIQAAERGSRVIVLSKGPVSRSGITPLAGSGFTASLHPEDSPEDHYRDTRRASRGLADARLARALAQDAPGQALWVSAAGHRFRRTEDGAFAQVIRPGQSHPRNLFSIGGGWSIAHALLLKSADYPNLRLVQEALALRLLADDGRVGGALYLDLKRGAVDAIRAGATILATGGYEQLWPLNDCPPDATGEGAILALEAGATLVDLEMELFYPTVAVYPPGLRGASVLPYEWTLNPDYLGGRLVNGRGEEFIQGLPLRDELSHAIHREIEAGRGSPHGGVYVDLVHSKHERSELIRRMRTYIPLHHGTLTRLGIDVTEQMLEVAPAAHYCCGGVHIDDRCSTGVPGLFAAGECSGNVHGANRMAGNALAEALVFGARAGDSASDFARANPAPRIKPEPLVRQEEDWIDRLATREGQGLRPTEFKKQIQQVVGRACPLRRDGPTLEKGLEAIRSLGSGVGNLAVDGARRGCFGLQEAREAAAMVRLAECVLLAALSRRETRGVHYRADYPQTEEAAVHTATRGGPEGLSVASIPVEP